MTDPGWVFAAISVFACAFAFVGLNVDGYWIDELFTVFVIDHRGGLSEVLTRALTDTQPPLYYGLLYGWARIFGHSEAALRALSAGLCVASVGVFVAGSRAQFSLKARLFTAAAVTTSPFFFVEAQDARNYALCLLITALLLVLSMRARLQIGRGSPPGAATIVGLCVVGAVGAFAHFYEFLTVGFVYLYLVVTVRSTRLRVALVGAGAMILVLQLGYIQLLLAKTQQNIHAMWFGSDAVYFGRESWEAFRALVGPGALVALASLGLAMTPRRSSALSVPSRRSRTVAEWSCAMGGVAIAAVFLAGVTISLAFAPSFSAKNLLVTSPLAWPVFAFLFDAADRPGGGRWTEFGTLLPALAIAAQAGLQFERFNPRHEPWRESARYVFNESACLDADIPVVFPSRFGQPTPFLRGLIANHIYGYYAGERSRRLRLVLGDELADPRANPTLRQRLGVASAGSCPVLAWAVHDVSPSWAEDRAAAMAAAAGVSSDVVRAVPFVSRNMVWGYLAVKPSGFVFVRARP